MFHAHKLIGLFLSGCLLYSCITSVNCDESDLYTYLTPKQKSVVPYHGNERIMFASTEGDTLTFECEGEGQYFNKTQKANGNLDCPQTWYLESLIYNFHCVQNSNISFQVINRVSTENSYSIVDFWIKDAPGIKSEDYKLTSDIYLKDTVQINGSTYKALTLYFNQGGIAGKWLPEYGWAQILLGTKYYTLCR